MIIIKKLFCSHKWKSHAIEKYEWTEKKVVERTEHWPHPIMETIEYSEVSEVLICQHCGKIKVIEY